MQLKTRQSYLSAIHIKFPSTQSNLHLWMMNSASIPQLQTKTVRACKIQYENFRVKADLL